MLLFSSADCYAERPLATEGARTIGAGGVNVEVGTEYLDDKQLAFDTRRTEREELALPVVGFAAGFGERVELQADFNMIYLEEAHRDNTYDVGDLTLSTKFLLLKESGDQPAIGFRLGTKLPNASNESRLGTDETDFFASLVGEKQFNALESRFNLGMGILGNPNENNNQDDVLTYGAAVLFPIEETAFTLVAEIFGQAASNEDNNYSTLRGGFILELAKDFALDVSARAGLTDESEDWGFGGGVTWEFTGLDF